MTDNEKIFLQSLKEIILKVDATADVILFGSRAREEAKQNSDWDILILTDRTQVTRLTEREYRDAIFDIQLESGEGVSAFVFSKKDWTQKHISTPLYENIKREGIYL